jgi:hypothetical protein
MRETPGIVHRDSYQADKANQDDQSPQTHDVVA